MEHWLSLPLQGSKEAPAIDHVIAMVHWLMLVLFVGWAIYYIYAIIRFRRSAHPKADYHGVRNKVALYLAGAVAVFELSLLFISEIPLWSQVKGTPPSEADAIVVRVVAEQFAWNIHYPGKDNKFGKADIKLLSAENPLALDRRDENAKDDITTINQLHLPAGKQVLVYLTSKDVIHSFGLPVMRVKQDAIPGQRIPVYFTPTVPGNYEIACAQLCGLGHFRMRGYLIIHTEVDYQKWLNEQAKELLASQAQTEATSHQ